MHRYVVTGGAGFIGSHLVHALLGQGASVRVIDNFSTGRKGNLPRDESEAGPGKLEVVEADIRDVSRVAEAVKGAEVVFHEAAFISVPESMERPNECLDVNVGGTSIVLEAARKAGVRRVVLASSAAVYGDSTQLPLGEETPVRPLSPYAASKATNELYASLYTQAFGVEVAALRYFNVYGPRQNPNSMYAAAVPIFIRKLLDDEPVTVFGDGRQTRDLIFVGDVVRANLIAAEHPAAPGETFNVCTGQATSILLLIEVLRRLFPKSQQPKFGPVRPGDIYASVGRPSKAEANLGFHTTTHLEDGLKATVEWMR